MLLLYMFWACTSYWQSVEFILLRYLIFLTCHVLNSTRTSGLLCPPAPGALPVSIFGNLGW